MQPGENTPQTFVGRSTLRPAASPLKPHPSILLPNLVIGTHQLFILHGSGWCYVAYTCTCLHIDAHTSSHTKACTHKHHPQHHHYHAVTHTFTKTSSTPSPLPCSNTHHHTPIYTRALARVHAPPSLSKDKRRRLQSAISGECTHPLHPHMHSLTHSLTHVHQLSH